MLITFFDFRIFQHQPVFVLAKREKMKMIQSCLFSNNHFIAFYEKCLSSTENVLQNAMISAFIFMTFYLSPHSRFDISFISTRFHLHLTLCWALTLLFKSHTQHNNRTYTTQLVLIQSSYCLNDDVKCRNISCIVSLSFFSFSSFHIQTKSHSILIVQWRRRRDENCARRPC